MSAALVPCAATCWERMPFADDGSHDAVDAIGALDSLGFGAYRQDAEAVLKDCKAVAAKRRRQSTRLENLGIPEEELLRQQQELFAQARQQQAELAQQEWTQMQLVAQQQLQLQQSQVEDDDEY
nr:protein Dr1-like [Rhipicephalus microplus]